MLAEAWYRRLSPIVPTSRSSRRRASGWINIERPRAVDRAWLEEHFDFHPLDYEDVLSRNQRPKVDEYEDYLFVVLHFPRFDKVVGRLNAAELDVFVGPDFVITLPNEPLQPLEYLFERCRAREDVRDALFGKGAGYLLYKIVDDCVDASFPMLNKMGNKLEHIEDDIFEGRSREVVHAISDVKQEIINFRKIVRPQRSALRDLERTRRYVPEDLEVYFDDIQDANERIWDLLENYKEVIEALEATNESVLSHQVNDILRVLTAFSVIVLPLTLIASRRGHERPLPGLREHRRVLGSSGRCWWCSSRWSATSGTGTGCSRWRCCAPLRRGCAAGVGRTAHRGSDRGRPGLRPRGVNHLVVMRNPRYTRVSEHGWTFASAAPTLRPRWVVQMRRRHRRRDELSSAKPQYPRAGSTRPDSSSPAIHRRICRVNRPCISESAASPKFARCGVISARGSVHSGWPSGSGSGSVTSSAAPAIEPAASAATSASVSTRTPRATFTSQASSDIASSSSAPMSPAVSGVDGAAITTTSASGSTGAARRRARPARTRPPADRTGSRR